MYVGVHMIILQKTILLSYYNDLQIYLKGKGFFKVLLYAILKATGKPQI